VAKPKTSTEPMPAPNQPRAKSLTVDRTELSAERSAELRAAADKLMGRASSPPASARQPTVQAAIASSASAASRFGTGFSISVGARTAWVDPASLDEHPLARKYFDLGDDDENAELLESVWGRQYTRLLVTGERCATQAGFTLDGRRRRRAALKAGVWVEVEYLDDLDAAGEFEIIVHSNIAATLARRLTERRKAQLEAALRQSYGERQGERSDLTSADFSGSGETRQLVADQMHESRNAVADRQVIFGSPASSELLKQKVEGGSIKRSAAAKLVRAAQQEPAVATVLQQARKDGIPFEQLAMHPVIVQAKAKVFAETEKLLGKKERRKRQKKPVVTQEAWGVLVAGAAALNILGKKLLFEVDGDNVHAVVVGVADPNPNIYEPLTPTTRLSWIADVQAAVDLLPGELRSQVTVGEPEVLDPFHCATCNGTRFYRRVGGCVKCEPLPPVDHGKILSKLEVEARAPKERLFQDLKRCAASPPTGEQERLLDQARRVIEHQVEEAREAAYPAAARAAYQEAQARDPRMADLTHVYSTVDLRYPRTRITLRTTRWELPIVLWECVRDSCGGSGLASAPGVIVGNDAPLVLNRTGPFASGSAAQPWNHCRSALRSTVHRHLSMLLGIVGGTTKAQEGPSGHDGNSNGGKVEQQSRREADPQTEVTSQAPVVASGKRAKVEVENQPLIQLRHKDAPSDPFGRVVDDSFIQKEIQRGAWMPLIVAPEVSGIPRPMTIFLAERRSNLIKWQWHGDKETFCPKTWADVAIGSGACGYACRSCFLMLTHRIRRDPLMPVVYTNGDAFEREVRKWLAGDVWWLTVEEETSGKSKTRRVPRTRPRQGAIGLGIDSADSLLWEGVTGHARRLIPLFTDERTNPRRTPLVLLTKSANTHFLAEISDHALRRVNGRVPNIAVTMSLNPEPIADLWEGKFPDTMERITPPIDRRLEALRAAQDMGFEVRARIDPIMTPDHWREMYADFFADMARVGLRPTMLTLGSHREKMSQLDKFREKWGLPAMEWTAEKTAKREGTHIHMVGREAVYRDVRDIIVHAFAGTSWSPWVSLCKETHTARKEAALLNANCNCLPQTEAPRRRLELYPQREVTP
jgi:DNA repair photolyase